ncbi:acetyl-CoA carboxylase 2-like, partial [Polyodon spathula]|uniref:acetyl-CoA carboxylase 2-like n=1 Tax=Polyodon spathula TaxID=7913 RepID=UPI001B7E7D3B
MIIAVLTGFFILLLIWKVMEDQLKLVVSGKNGDVDQISDPGKQTEPDPPPESETTCPSAQPSSQHNSTVVSKQAEPTASNTSTAKGESPENASLPPLGPTHQAQASTWAGLQNSSSSVPVQHSRGHTQDAPRFPHKAALRRERLKFVIGCSEDNSSDDELGMLDHRDGEASRPAPSSSSVVPVSPLAPKTMRPSMSGLHLMKKGREHNRMDLHRDFTVASPAEFVTRFGGDRVIEKVLIANNGIAAVKCMRSIRRWSYEMFRNERAIRFVVMVTPEDLKANAGETPLNELDCITV